MVSAVNQVSPDCFRLCSASSRTPTAAGFTAAGVAVNKLNLSLTSGPFKIRPLTLPIQRKEVEYPFNL